MKISGRRDYMAGLESVAMTDIVLNMFIFFFISFSLLYTFSPERIQKLDVRLPGAASAKAVEGKAEVNITVTAEGSIYLEKEPVSEKELKDKIMKIYKEKPDTPVFLHSDKMAHFKDVVDVLDVLKEVGVKNLNIAAEVER